VTVDVRASGSLPSLARRRARLWLERPTAAGGVNPEAAPLPPPVVVTDWPFADLY
jgi:predicted Abi (CAAX) family protease